MKVSVSLILSSLLTSLGLSLIVMPTLTESRANGQTVQPISALPDQATIFNLPQPPDTGTPVGRRTGGGDRDGGGSRDREPYSANDTWLPLTALMPAQSIEQSTAAGDVTFEYVWSYTAEAQPTFWFYLPYPLDGSAEVTFVVQDERQQPIENGVLTLRPSWNPGIVSVSLPPTMSPLEVGRHYHWSFAVDDGTTLEFVEGWIYRIDPAPPLAQHLQTVPPQEQMRLYASHGIWQDALDLVAQLYQTEPEDSAIAQDWRSLLNSVGLEPIAHEEFSH